MMYYWSEQVDTGKLKLTQLKTKSKELALNTIIFQHRYYATPSEASACKSLLCPHIFPLLDAAE